MVNKKWYHRALFGAAIAYLSFQLTIFVADLGLTLPLNVWSLLAGGVSILIVDFVLKKIGIMVI